LGGMSDDESLTRRTVELLHAVIDQESFNAFLDALIEEREAADVLERERPEYYRYGGAMDWQNSSISSYLSAASTYFEIPRESVGTQPSWRNLAEFLWLGKIYE
jgi:hypothetical protein